MELVLRAAALYLALFILMRISGQRQFSQLTTFDAVLIIMIAEVTGQALVGEDYSVTGAILVIAILIGIDIVASLVKHRSRRVRRIMEGIPIMLIEKGEVKEDNLRRARIELTEILESARQSQGIESLKDVKYAVLERSGGISVITWD